MFREKLSAIGQLEEFTGIAVTHMHVMSVAQEEELGSGLTTETTGAAPQTYLGKDTCWA